MRGGDFKMPSVSAYWKSEVKNLQPGAHQPPPPPHPPPSLDWYLNAKSKKKNERKRYKIRLIIVKVTGQQIVGDFVPLRPRKVRKADRR